VAAAQANPAAFDALYRQYFARVYRYLLARTETPDDAADLTQQVFLQALDALPRYRDRGVPFGAWLFRIARHAVANSRRRRGAVPWDSLPEPLRESSLQGPEVTVLQQESHDHLRRLLLDLPPSKRELVLLRFVGGLTVREIAALLGKKEPAIYKQLSRILHTLKETYDACS
jgi:RNA polymerase sigma-70 factor (ECF subfamily)